MFSFFQEYKSTLQLACEQYRAHDYGWVNWTVAEETADLIYYQSYYGYGMGWKIHVLDEGEEPNVSAQVGGGNWLLLWHTTLLMLFIMATFPSF